MNDEIDPAVLDECRHVAGTWAPVLQALGNPERLLITLWLAGTASSVRDLERVTALSQSLVSYHLRALRDAGLVTATAHGRSNLYRLAHPDLDKLAALVGELSARTADPGDGAAGDTTRVHGPAASIHELSHAAPPADASGALTDHPGRRGPRRQVPER